MESPIGSGNFVFAVLVFSRFGAFGRRIPILLDDGHAMLETASVSPSVSHRLAKGFHALLLSVLFTS